MKSLNNSNLIGNVFNFLNIKRKLQLIKYSKKYQKILNISRKDYYLFLNSIKLKSAENEIFTINKKAAKRSALLQNYKEDDENLNVESKILKLIIEFLEHYQDSEPKLPQKPLKDSNVMQYLDEWSKNFFSKIKLEDIIPLINASEYMGIECLLIICIAILASKMMDLPIEEVQKKFGIEYDLTEEEMKEFEKYPLN